MTEKSVFEYLFNYILEINTVGMIRPDSFDLIDQANSGKMVSLFNHSGVNGE